MAAKEEKEKEKQPKEGLKIATTYPPIAVPIKQTNKYIWKQLRRIQCPMHRRRHRRRPSWTRGRQRLSRVGRTLFK